MDINQQILDLQEQLNKLTAYQKLQVQESQIKPIGSGELFNPFKEMTCAHLYTISDSLILTSYF